MFSVKNVKNLNKPASVVVVTVGRPVDVAVVIPPFDRAVTFRLCVVVAPTVKVHETREIHVICTSCTEDKPLVTSTFFNCILKNPFEFTAYGPSDSNTNAVISFLCLKQTLDFYAFPIIKCP